MDGFLKKFKQDPDALIGVHCTHGLNRTGYLICKYMVKRLKVNPEEAISKFEFARGHRMTKRMFIDDLLQRAPREIINQESRRCAKRTSKYETKYTAKIKPCSLSYEKRP